MFGRTGYSTNTGCGEKSSLLLSELRFSEATCATRAIQVASWLRFCDEDMVNGMPAGDVDIMSFIGYLSLEGRISTSCFPL